MALNLIDVPDDYYLDELFFSNPEDLKNIFQKLEEDNLSLIKEQQELSQQYELLVQHEQRLHNELESKYREQSQTKEELEKKI